MSTTPADAQVAYPPLALPAGTTAATAPKTPVVSLALSLMPS